MFSETYQIGKSSNPADALPRVGKKNLQTEAEVSFIYSYKYHFNSKQLLIYVFIFRLQEKSKPKLKQKKPKELPYNKSEDGKPQLVPLTKN